MHKNKVLDFVVLIEQDAEGWYVATVPSLQGCHTQGRTIPQVLERVKEAIQVCLEADLFQPSIFCSSFVQKA